MKTARTAGIARAISEGRSAAGPDVPDVPLDCYPSPGYAADSYPDQGAAVYRGSPWLPVYIDKWK